MLVMILANFDGGLFHFRKELIQALLSENEIIISLPYGELVDPLVMMGCKFIDVPVDRRGINPITDFKLYKMYRKILAREMPDLVITYTVKPNVYGGWACRALMIPYAMNITGLGTAFENGGVLKIITTLMNRAACKKAKVVFFENEENRYYFIKEKIVKEKQTYRLNGAGVNLEKYQVTDYPEGKKIKFLFMGRIMAEKGSDELFLVMQDLVADGVDCELDVLGSFEENYKDSIEKYESLGWLHYHGYQKDVKPFINAAHCVVLPSWHEGMANTNLESAASARPVITSNIPGCKEAVIDGVSGYLTERKNKDDLYKKMKKFAELTYEDRKAMGLAGRIHMEEFFDRKTVVAETKKILGL